MDIASFRNRIGLSQSELAEKLGLATSSVGNLCSGSKRPSYEIIEKLFLLGARVDEIFDNKVSESVFRNSVDFSFGKGKDFDVSPDLAEKIVAVGLLRLVRSNALF